MEEQEQKEAAERALSGEEALLAEDVMEDLLKDPVQKKSGRFYIKNQKMHLTYHFHIKIDRFLKYIKELLATVDNGIKEYSIVHETGDKTVPHNHTHAAFWFNKSLEITLPTFFDYDDGNPENQKHPNIKCVSNKKLFDDICDRYHKKENSPKTNRVRKQKQESKYVVECGKGQYYPTKEGLEACRTDNDVALLVAKCGAQRITQTGSYIIAWKALKNKPEPPDTRELPMLKKWQKELLDYLLDTSNDRIIPWIVDVTGGAGKSVLGDYMVRVHGAIVLTSLNSSNALHTIRKYKDEGIPIRYIIINLTRTTGDYVGVYTIIESLKDGRFTSGKYDSINITIKPAPCVCVMSNTKPDIERLSADRWDVMFLEREAIRHVFKGETAFALHNEMKLMKKKREIPRKIEEKQNIEIEVRDLNLLDAKVWPIEAYDEGSIYIGITDILLLVGKVGTISYTYRPLTEDEMWEGIKKIKTRKEILFLMKNPHLKILPTSYLTDTEQLILQDPYETVYHKLTRREIETGQTVDIHFSYRDMTEPEKRGWAMTENDKRRKRREELKAWARKVMAPKWEEYLRSIPDKTEEDIKLEMEQYLLKGID